MGQAARRGKLKNRIFALCRETSSWKPLLTTPGHVQTTWHSLGTCSMAPRGGNSIVKHGVLDERLNVHGTQNLKVADLSVCPDNVGCNTYSTALLIGEKCAVLTAEDLGYSGSALDMKVPNYHAPREIANLQRL